MLMRSKLFVPASRPELFAKAMASQADVVSFDLEVAVEPASKERARAALNAFFADTPGWQGRGKGIVVRVNAVDTPHFDADLGVAACAGVDANVVNPDGYLADARAARRLGFAGKSCIHPTQIAPANQAFRPTDADIAHALKVVEATRPSLAAGIGAFLVDGRLVDGPFIAQATRTVAIATRLGLLPEGAAS